MFRRGTEASRKGLGWGLLLAVSIAIAGQTAIGRSVGAGSKRANARMTLRVYNYAVSPSLLSRAEKEATVILNHAGVEPAWLDCGLVPTEFDKYPGCKRSIGPTDFILKILNKEQTKRFSKRRAALGLALECPASQGGCYAYVFYRDIEVEASAAGATGSQLLGHIMAHEIGHMLLGPSHSVTGVMRASWSYEDLQAIAGTYLFFTPQEAGRMRRELRARSAQRLSIVSSAPLPDSKAVKH